MARGRPADPSRARRKTGNRPVASDAGKAALVALPDLPTRLIPAMPDHIPDAAKPMWDRIIGELLERGVKDLDFDLAGVLVVALLRHRQACLQLEDLLVVDDKGRITANPLLKIERDQANTIMRVATELGLTPAARLRLGLMQLAGQSILAGLNQDLDRRIGGPG
ncbi:MAG: phage terminase small subunit P27 family [Candidatus Nanopelagicales bacterium]